MRKGVARRPVTDAGERRRLAATRPANPVGSTDGSLTGVPDVGGKLLALQTLRLGTDRELNSSILQGVPCLYRLFLNNTYLRVLACVNCTCFILSYGVHNTDGTSIRYT